MNTTLKIVRRNSESGSIKGIWKDKKIEFVWNSHELRVNGKLKPNGHPFEDVAEKIMESVDEKIRDLKGNDWPEDVGCFCLLSLDERGGFVFSDFEFVA